MDTTVISSGAFWESAYPLGTSWIGLLALLLPLLGLAVLALVVYGAVRLGVRHGRRDALDRASAAPTTDPPVPTRP